MRLSDVREAIITVHETTARTQKVAASDVFKVLRSAREPEQANDGTVMVKLLSTGRDATNTCDAHFAVYQCVYFYQPSPDVDDRIGADAEVMHDPLWSLHETEADIQECQPGEVYVEEAEGRIVARRDVRVIYRRDQL